MNIYLCGVFDGPFTGQLQTLLGVKDSLDKNYNIKLIKSPVLSFSYVFTWPLFILKIFLISITQSKDKDIFYVLINRTKLSFWLRDLPVFLIAFATKSRVICHLVGSDIEQFINKSNKIEKFLLTKIFSKIDSWILLGNSMKKQIMSTYKYLNITNKAKCFKDKKLKAFFLKGFYPKDADSFYNEITFKEKLDSFGENLKISYMSNLMEDKGIVEFIESVISLNEEFNFKIDVNIAGAVIEKSSERLEKALNKASKKSYINFLGLVKGNEKWELLSKTDIFILPTYYKTEALPLSLIEAMRFGCLCISSNIGEINDLLKHERGELIENITTKNLTSTIQSVLSDTELAKYKMNNSRIYAKNQFSFHRYKKNLINIIKEHID